MTSVERTEVWSDKGGKGLQRPRSDATKSQDDKRRKNKEMEQQE